VATQIKASAVRFSPHLRSNYLHRLARVSCPQAEASLIAGIEGGLTNIHTTANPGAEIRG
jgi:hypothetical protein